MGIKKIKIAVDEVTIGMFVSGLDRPWIQTPFPIQGFYVRDANDISQLRSYCRHIYIDASSTVAPAKSDLKTTEPDKRNKMKGRERQLHQGSAVVAPIKIKTDTYRHLEPLGKEIKRAKQLHQRVFGAVSEVMSQLDQGTLVSAHETRRAAGSMVDSVIRNPDAFTWLSRIRKADEHTWGHSVRSAVWAILFGRHIGLAKSELDPLALGVLLKDVGKTRLPKSLLINGQRSSVEQTEYESFVEKGVDILRQLPGVEPRVIAVVKTHCERINGSGYPNHLRGDQIPLPGKIAGIVTFYDEATNPRGGSDPMAPSRAVSCLYRVRGVEFQEDLVVEFIRGIGLYPTGTLVELTTGEVGVVIEQNFDRRLKPKVVLLLDAFKKPLRKHRFLDMAEDDRRKQAMLDSGKYSLYEAEKIEIAQDLEPGSYNIDINRVHDRYLMKGKKRNLFSFFSR